MQPSGHTDHDSPNNGFAWNLRGVGYNFFNYLMGHLEMSGIRYDCLFLNI